MATKGSKHFWNRWSTEYFNTLQKRSKWTSWIPDIKFGDILILKWWANLSLLTWRLERIIRHQSVSCSSEFCEEYYGLPYNMRISVSPSKFLSKHPLTRSKSGLKTSRICYTIMTETWLFLSVSRFILIVFKTMLYHSEFKIYYDIAKSRYNLTRSDRDLPFYGDNQNKMRNVMEELNKHRKFNSWTP